MHDESAFEELLLERALNRFDPEQRVLKVNEDLEEFPHQVAGHTKEPVWKYKNFVLKPMLKPKLFMRELCVYEELLTLSETEDISDFFAPYHGAVNCITDEASSDTIHHIVLSDLTVNYERPCVIDIKIGRFTYEPSVDASKKQREKLKYIYQEEIGFRITGLKVFDGVENNYLVTNKQFGRSLLPSQIVLRKLHKILTWMRAQTKYQFYCSSILIIYASAEIAGTAETVSSNAEVRMIDLAHTMSEEGVLDEGYIHGLRNLITYLEQLLPRHSEQEMQAQCEHSWNLLDLPELSIGIERLSL